MTCSYDQLVTKMNTHTSSLVPPMLRSKATILDKSLSRGKQEISLAAFALLFSETVQYCQVMWYLASSVESGKFVIHP